MKIKNHILEGVQHDWMHGGTEMSMRRALVIHFTSGATGKSSIAYWRKLNNGVGAHLVIERTGEIVQVREFNRTFGHAGPPGKSRWRNPLTGKTLDGCNSFTIGIELANAGDDADVQKIASRLPGFAGVTAAIRHKNESRPKVWEIYPQAQFDACVAVSKLLVEAYNLDDICGHEDVAPERKIDPGPAFDMIGLREACGFKGAPFVNFKTPR